MLTSKWMIFIISTIIILLIQIGEVISTAKGKEVSTAKEHELDDLFSNIWSDEVLEEGNEEIGKNLKASKNPIVQEIGEAFSRLRVSDLNTVSANQIVEDVMKRHDGKLVDYTLEEAKEAVKEVLERLDGSDNPFVQMIRRLLSLACKENFKILLKLKEIISRAEKRKSIAESSGVKKQQNESNVGASSSNESESSLKTSEEIISAEHLEELFLKKVLGSDDPLFDAIRIMNDTERIEFMSLLVDLGKSVVSELEKKPLTKSPLVFDPLKKSKMKKSTSKQPMEKSNSSMRQQTEVTSKQQKTKQEKASSSTPQKSKADSKQRHKGKQTKNGSSSQQQEATPLRIKKNPSSSQEQRNEKKGPSQDQKNNSSQQKRRKPKSDDKEKPRWKY